MTNIFQDFFEFDTLLHTTSGFILAYLGFKLIMRINKKNNLTRKIIIIFAICFSMFFAFIWELFEVTSDFFFITDMQTDRTVYRFSSKKLNGDNPNIIDNIDHTIIYDKNNQVIMRMDGYLDIGILDTMKDLFVNFIGALLFALIYILKRKKYKKIRFSVT